ncbi:small GTP-binding protein [Mycolicibacterium fortuitum subsp. acetamidolyticum]|uniref:Small GTP-binding protein n=1 Tax=Mycolicibacterium fortuitum subsp. acetamidolyticum TaxID=144550 RepID=A0A117IEE4_MYCFO|nr:small GTP-binding protein [Mycolicibacterium fortuitum subsp. acetamidolyticum]
MPLLKRIDRSPIVELRRRLRIEVRLLLLMLVILLLVTLLRMRRYLRCVLRRRGRILAIALRPRWPGMRYRRVEFRLITEARLPSMALLLMRGLVLGTLRGAQTRRYRPVLIMTAPRCRLLITMARLRLVDIPR